MRIFLSQLGFGTADFFWVIEKRSQQSINSNLRYFTSVQGEMVWLLAMWGEQLIKILLVLERTKHMKSEN